jgi:quercetin dioxygenase-like cupin family protein
MDKGLEIAPNTITLRHGGTITYERELTTREKVNAVEGLMKEKPQVDIPTKHYFSKGVYAREITIPKGVILTGHIHKYQNLNIISKGKIEVLVGDELKIIEAPATIVSPPGTKRIARALEETVWTTVHGTEETDIDKIEQIFICKTDAEYLEFEKQLQLPLEKPKGGHLDY